MALYILFNCGVTFSAAFIPWDPLVNNSWIDLYPDDRIHMYSIDGGVYDVGFGLPRYDGGARGMNALKFSVGFQNTGHLVSSELAGSFDIQNTGSRTFRDLLLLIAIDANFLEDDFTLSITSDCLDSNDFSFYDPNFLNYGTGRPSGYCAPTSPSREDIAYNFSSGMVTIYAIKGINLGPGYSATVNYCFQHLHSQAVFSVYGYDSINGYIYHTNRAFLDNNDPSSLVSTFAVVPLRPSADFNGDWHVNMVDFSYFSKCWLQPAGQDPNGLCHHADLSANGFVSFEDLAEFANQYLN
jgi:hypothetical protein